MQLNRVNLTKIGSGKGLDIPEQQLFDLQEKVLQFGTGVLLRALPDYFIDKANKKGIFNGRVVVVKSTDSDSSAFDRQNGLYTVGVRGVENGVAIEDNIINASISRVISAASDWGKVMDCAHNPQLRVVISNTTEVGIQLVQDDISQSPPVSFPGKLLAFLYERYKAFGGSTDSGLVIIPTELITDNGATLKSIVFELAHRNGLNYKFIEWLEEANSFCNSLVDRIVPGKPRGEELKHVENDLGYVDENLTMSEAFRLWAIQGDEHVKEILSFHSVDPGMIIASDISLFKELKLRLLNGTHTFNCGLAFLCGFNITREAVTDPLFSQFVKGLMHHEIARAIPYEIEENQKTEFANKVFERFCNPFIDHQWLSITVQNCSKMKMRNVPLILNHYRQTKEPPLYMATGFAGFLLFMKATRKDGNRYFGLRDDAEYEIKDDRASYFSDLWANSSSLAYLVHSVLGNQSLWEADLSSLPGFENLVTAQLASMMERGAFQTIRDLVGTPVRKLF